MWFASFYRGLQSRSHARRTARPCGKSPQRRPAVKLRLEPLEDRTLPSAASLDPTFGIGGEVITDFIGSGDDKGADAVVEPDGKLVVVGTSTSYSSSVPESDVALARYNADGGLDTSFGTAGRTVTDFGTAGDFGRRIARQADGKLIVAGGAGGSFAVARYHPNGTLDSTFDGDGKVTTPIGQPDSRATGLAVQADGKIVLSGYAAFGTSTGYDFVLIRYNADGTLDSSFGVGGKVITNFASYDFAGGVALQADGKLVITGGSSPDGSSYEFALARYNYDGGLDTSFGIAGKVTIGFTDFARESAFGSAIAVQVDGRLVVAGEVQDRPGGVLNRDVALVRLNADGSLDNMFGSGGKVVTPLGGSNPGTPSNLEGASDVELENDGRIIVAVDDSHDAFSCDNFLLARYQSDGAVDSSFGTGGVLEKDMGSDQEAAESVVVQADGGIVAVGALRSGPAGNRAFDFALARFTVTGADDGSFGTDGRVTTDFPGSRGDQAYGLVIQNDGRIVAIGGSSSPGTDQDFAIARYRADGTPDSTFGTNGIITTDYSFAQDAAFDAGVQVDGKIVAVGMATMNDTGRDVALARYNLDGSLDTTFGTAGKVTTAYSTGQDAAGGLSIQQDGKLVIAVDDPHDALNWGRFTLGRYNPNGTPDSSFGSAGRVDTYFGSQREAAFTTAVRKNNRIIAAGSAAGDFALAQYNPDGSLDATFGVGGKVTTDFDHGFDGVAKVFLLPDDEILAVGTATLTGAGNVVAFARFKADGTLDSAFGAGGKVTNPIAGHPGAWISDVTLQNDGKIVVAIATSGDFLLYRYNADGTPDTGFGPSGAVVTDFGGVEQISGIAMQTDGRIVAAGFSLIPTNGDNFLLARYSSVTSVGVSGRVFADANNDGLVNGADTGLGGVTLQLFNENDLVNAVATTTSNGQGDYTLTGVPAGTYRIVEIQPAGYLDGNESAGSLGGVVDNTQDSNLIRNIVVQAGAADAGGYNFAEICPSRLQGLVWVDFNNDGEVDFGESAIAGVTIHLTGLDDRGSAVTRSMITDGQGIFEFLDLRPSGSGGYTLTEEQPTSFADGQEHLGTVNGVLSGVAADNIFSQIGLSLPCSDGVNYNFGERPPAGSAVTQGQTATIGFWQNKNGQNLLKSLNGGPASTQLANWLAETLPNMYGASAGGNNLTGKTNDQVAVFYVTLFKRTSAVDGPPKLDAQVLATALSVYVTNQTLSGNTAASYGFTVTTYGLGASTINVGSNGDAFGVANNSVLTVLDLLRATDAQAVNGVLYNGNTARRNAANNVYSAVNQSGNIG